MTAVNAVDNNTTINDKLNQISTASKNKNNVDENLFLKILASELQNQDPQNAKDGTEYVTQMAQFSALQQMANLNSTMKMTGANSLIGKTVVLSKFNQNGQLYSGKVLDVIKDGDNVEMDVVVGQKKDADGKLEDDVRQFDLNDVYEVKQSNDVNNSANMSMNLLNAAALIGKIVTLSDIDNNNNNYTGKIKNISKDGDKIKVNVEISAGQTKEFPVDDITSVSNE
ncbi:flagellar hook capping FlgD N-terminal domain-containing protein [Clostridium sp. JN-1]|uniref:flagellar hook capping FlgD N-terminal domain-containing protein n=1 Tax=Clostridium sp. JN-1 TaxID=2483110 RepID=UPI000F0B5A99|nr:flagellar hook capping FlgD N-terminal domain-containing protein [Clostridium sp. JN-1]